LTFPLGVVFNLLMRRPFIAANWKMHKTIAEALEFVKEFLPLVEGAPDVDKVLAPAFTAIRAVADALRGTEVIVAAQDVFYEQKGAYTGEVAPGMLKEAGASMVIVGHSERRQYFGETDQVVNRKLRAALEAGLGVILCMGESLQERQEGLTFQVLKRQLDEGLKGLQSLKGVVLAYEPIWAIGTGMTATKEQAQEAHAFIRQEVAEHFGEREAQALRVIYGGSVKPENIAGLMGQPDVDGALVGGASLQARSFAAIVNFQEGQ